MHDRLRRGDPKSYTDSQDLPQIQIFAEMFHLYLGIYCCLTFEKIITALTPVYLRKRCSREFDRFVFWNESDLVSSNRVSDYMSSHVIRIGIPNPRTYSSKP